MLLIASNNEGTSLVDLIYAVTTIFKKKMLFDINCIAIERLGHCKEKQVLGNLNVKVVHNGTMTIT